MTTKLLYEQDGDLSLVQDRSVTVVGYGSQGRAHALNLRDSGVRVTVGLRPGKSKELAVQDGFSASDVQEAVRDADVVMVLTPDETMREVYEADIRDNMKQDSTLAFAHGFNVYYNQIVPRADLDVVMVAPKAPGPMVRDTYLQGQGVPHLIATWQDSTGMARDVALAYAIANGAGSAGIIETTFKDETETDLFGEQAVLCGGLVELVKCGFEVLVENGYEPELAYFECLHELKLIADLMHEQGITGLNKAISNNAEYGEYVSGPRLITSATKKAMAEILQDIRVGRYAKDFLLEQQVNHPTLIAKRRLLSGHQIELVGRQLRSGMSWMKPS